MAVNQGREHLCGASRDVPRRGGSADGETLVGESGLEEALGMTADGGAEPLVAGLVASEYATLAFSVTAPRPAYSVTEPVVAVTPLADATLPTSVLGSTLMDPACVRITTSPPADWRMLTMSSASTSSIAMSPLPLLLSFSALTCVSISERFSSTTRTRSNPSAKRNSPCCSSGQGIATL